MKFTLSWLKDHLETSASLDEILTALTDLGHEVEGVEDPAARLGAFRICRVIEAVQHPNADRLRVCRVATWPQGPEGAMEEVQVVCGAPNAPLTSGSRQRARFLHFSTSVLISRSASRHSSASRSPRWK